MDKTEQAALIEQFKAAMNEKKLEEAVEIADLLDIKHVKDNNLLSIIADAYEQSKDYELAKKVLLYAYENTNAGRNLAYRLCLISIKNGEFEDAEEFYEDFVEMAPKDTSRYVLQYKMAKAQNESKDRLIKILKEYVMIDMEEKWAYELAKLYHDIGEDDKCVELCDEMGLWFPEGKYIKKAMKLKSTIAPLNSTQQQLLRQSEEPKEEPVAHKSKSPMESIMERQPKRYKEKEPYEQPRAVMPDFPTMVQPGDTGKIYIETPEVENAEPHTPKLEIPKWLNKSTEESIEAAVEKREPEYKPSFDITEIKLAEPEVSKRPEEILTAQPVEEGPQQMSFFNDDTPSNNKYVAPGEKSEEPKVPEAKHFEMPKDIPTKQHEEIKNVEDVLKDLEARGILGKETVEQAVHLIDSDETFIDDDEEEVVIAEEEVIAEEPVAEANVEVREEVEIEDFANEDEVKYQTKQVGSKWESEQERVIDNEPVEAGTMDDFEYYDEPGLKENPTEEISLEEVQQTIIEDMEEDSHDMEEDPHDMELVETEDDVPDDLFGEDDELPDELEDAENTSKTQTVQIPDDVMDRPTEMVPELPSDGKPTIKPATILSEAVPPKSETPEDVPVFDLSGEYKSSDNNAEENVDNVDEVTETVEMEEAVVAAPVHEATTSDKPKAKIDMIAGEAPVKEEVEETEEMVETLTEEDTSHYTAPIKIPKDKLENVQNVKPHLDDEDMAAFGNYMNVEGLEEKIRKVLTSLIDNYESTGRSMSGNVIVMGDQQTGKTTMAIEILKIVNKKRRRVNRKIAKIDAEVLNKKSFAKAFKKLIGNDLIIENAHRLSHDTIMDILECRTQFTDDMLIVLEAETEPMEMLLNDYLELQAAFDNVIKIKQYNLREWVTYGNEYAKTKGYCLDEVAELALFKTIDDAFGAHEGISKEDVEDIIDLAIEKHGRLGKKISGIFSSNKEGLSVLDESDFNISLK